jgi:hypothetical protein
MGFLDIAGCENLEENWAKRVKTRKFGKTWKILWNPKNLGVKTRIKTNEMSVILEPKFEGIKN